MNQEPVTLRASAESTLSDLKQRFPNSPFLALGQTALWDEPTKASLRRALDTIWPEARMIAAAHDTDYFAKLPGHPSSAEHGSYALVLHDDARTRGLWSAAGEMSQLFGSEDVVTRDMLRDIAGVTLHRALSQADDPTFLLSELTVAWGWTGIIYTEWDRKVVQDVLLVDILPTLLEQIDSAMQGSAECLTGGRAEAARTLAGTVKNWVTSYSRFHPEASLADLYRDLLPRFYELLLNAPAAHLTTSKTTELLRFNTETAGLPRFTFVDLFINPKTRQDAIDSYNLAIAGSDIYTLDQFGEGALPFDIAIPGRGRGTLRLTDKCSVTIDLPREPITLEEPDCELKSVSDLAQLLERHLGSEITLVGKAVSLLPMLTAEHILVFHEGASAYSSRTHDMVVQMRSRRLPVPELRPILRIRYDTWNAMEAVQSQSDEDHICLPEYLAQAFRREKISFHDFASCWEYAKERERSRLRELSELRSPRRLLEYFARMESTEWESRRQAHEKATLALLELRDRSQAVQGEILTLLDEAGRLTAEALALEKAMGDDFRERLYPLLDEDTATALVTTIEREREEKYRVPITERRTRIREIHQLVRQKKVQRKVLERCEEAVNARAELHRIEGMAETEKARLAGNSLRAINGLYHTANRPSSWWFPLVDPSGAWFRNLTETAEYYLEPLDQ